MARPLWLCAAVLLFAASGLLARAQDPPSLDLFFQAADADDRVARKAMDALSAQWRDAYTAMIIDIARQLRRAPARPESAVSLPSLDAEPSGGGELTTDQSAPRMSREAIIRGRLLRFLERQTRKRFDDTLNGWRQWMWELPYEPHPQYAEFKGLVYSRIDPRMQRFFPADARSLIRLDEIDWGGVVVNGIPPLVYPRVLQASEAGYLRDNNIVFGVVVNGEARAYPKRILAWHEMAIDRIGGIELTVVYCTLCGTVIPYNSTVAGRVLRFGTSGLLYRSNKLMFDEATLSLWSALEGKPVVGPLVGMDVELTPREVVTTTWGEWRAVHPDTTVLSEDTGHRRDYREGAAYREYFATDDLYFRVSRTDRRLKNKEEVLTLRVKPKGVGPLEPVAITAALLKKNPAFHFDVGGRRFVAVTSPQGANRVYDVSAEPVVFQSRRAADVVLDSDGQPWRTTEDALVSVTAPTRRLPRVAAARAFWFGWYAQFPETVLIR